MNNTWIPVDETSEGSYQCPAVSLRAHSMTSGADLVGNTSRAGGMWALWHRGVAAANRFENDPLGQPRANCRAVSTWLIIPHTDGGYLLLSITPIRPITDMLFDYFFFPSQNVAATSHPMAEKLITPWTCLSWAPVSLTWGGIALPNPSPHLSGFEMKKQQSQASGGRVARTLFMACGWTAGCLGSPGNSHSPLFVFHHQPPGDTFSFTRRHRGCENTFWCELYTKQHKWGCAQIPSLLSILQGKNNVVQEKGLAFNQIKIQLRPSVWHLKGSINK